MSGIHVNFNIQPEQFLADLTEAAYGVALKHGFSIPFIDVELDFYKALREVIQKDMLVSPLCGATKACREAARFDPWSKKGEEIFNDMRGVDCDDNLERGLE